MLTLLFSAILFYSAAAFINVSSIFIDNIRLYILPYAQK